MWRRTVPMFGLSPFPLHQTFYDVDFVKYFKNRKPSIANPIWGRFLLLGRFPPKLRQKLEEKTHILKALTDKILLVGWLFGLSNG
jgi:hypothetical protein